MSKTVEYYAARNKVEFIGGNRCRIGGQDGGWFDANKTLEGQRVYAARCAEAALDLAVSAAQLKQCVVVPKKAIAHRKQMIVQHAGLLMLCLERIQQIEARAA